MRWNERLFLWIVFGLFRLEGGQTWPLPAKVLRWILLPIDNLKWHLGRDRIMHYDPYLDVFHIFGTKYSGALMRLWGQDSGNIGAVVEIIKTGDGTVTLTRHHEFEEELKKRRSSEEGRRE